MRGAAEGNVALTDATRARAVSAESELEQRLQMHDALSHVAALPQAQREAIFLTVIDGQSQDEVASAMGITNGAVRGLLYRARTTLRRAAAAITPHPLIAWAAGGSGGAGTSAERLTEATTGAGALGVSGVIVKGAALAVTAGALATSAVVHFGAPARHEHSGPAVARVARAISADTAGSARGAGLSLASSSDSRTQRSSAAAGSSSRSLAGSGAHRQVPGHSRTRPADGRAGGEVTARWSPAAPSHVVEGAPQPAEAVATTAGTGTPAPAEPPAAPPAEKPTATEQPPTGGGDGAGTEKGPGDGTGSSQTPALESGTPGS